MYIASFIANSHNFYGKLDVSKPIEIIKYLHNLDDDWICFYEGYKEDQYAVCCISDNQFLELPTIHFLYQWWLIEVGDQESPDIFSHSNNQY